MVVTIKLMSFSVDLNSEYETIETDSRISGAPNENIVQNHLNIALLNVFSKISARKKAPENSR